MRALLAAVVETATVATQTPHGTKWPSCQHPHVLVIFSAILAFEMCIDIYIYIYTCIYIHINIYIYMLDMLHIMCLTGLSRPE